MRTFSLFSYEATHWRFAVGGGIAYLAALQGFGTGQRPLGQRPLGGVGLQPGPTGTNDDYTWA